MLTEVISWCNYILLVFLHEQLLDLAAAKESEDKFSHF